MVAHPGLCSVAASGQPVGMHLPSFCFFHIFWRPIGPNQTHSQAQRQGSAMEAATPLPPAGGGAKDAWPFPAHHSCSGRGLEKDRFVFFDLCGFLFCCTSATFQVSGSVLIYYHYSFPGCQTLYSTLLTGIITCAITVLIFQILGKLTNLWLETDGAGLQAQ